MLPSPRAPIKLHQVAVHASVSSGQREWGREVEEQSCHCRDLMCVALPHPFGKLYPTEVSF